jgi:hypothetical protein
MLLKIMPLANNFYSQADASARQDSFSYGAISRVRLFGGRSQNFSANNFFLRVTEQLWATAFAIFGTTRLFD